MDNPEYHGKVVIALVDSAYAGRIDRRTFVRGLIAAGITAAVARDMADHAAQAQANQAAQETSGGLSIPAPAPVAFGITDAAQSQFVQSRFTPHPFNTFVSPLKLANKVGNGLPTNYIICADPLYKPLEASRNWVKAAGWKTLEIKSGHDAMVIAPDRLADMLDADAA